MGETDVKKLKACLFWIQLTSVPKFLILMMIRSAVRILADLDVIIMRIDNVEGIPETRSRYWLHQITSGERLLIQTMIRKSSTHSYLLLIFLLIFHVILQIL